MSKGLPDPNFWRGRRVLLTGHTGFKGAWAALWLADMGAEVSCIALPPETDPNLFELANVSSHTKSMIGDLGDLSQARGALDYASPEIIIHMAAQALVRRSYREPVSTFATNVMGTVNILEAARNRKNLRACIVVTSDKVYENDGMNRPFAEDSRLGGHDPYSASKAAAEIAVSSYRRSFFTDTATKIATARGGNVIGGGDFSEDRIVPDIWRAHQSHKQLVLRYPDATRPWQHVLDCLCGYFVYAEHLANGTVDEPSLNFGPREKTGRPVRDLVSAMQGAIGAKEGWKQAEGPQPKEMPALALTCEKAEQTLGWQSRLDARATIEWTADWYKAFAAGEDAGDITQRQIRAYENA